MLRVFSDTGEPFTIYRNPSALQLATCLQEAPCGEVKGLLTDAGQTLYIWAAWYAHHLDLVAREGISEFTHLEIGPKGPSLSSGAGKDPNFILTSPAICRLFGKLAHLPQLPTAQPAMMSIYGTPPDTPDRVRSANRKRKQLGMKRLPSVLPSTNL